MPPNPGKMLTPRSPCNESSFFHPKLLQPPELRHSSTEGEAPLSPLCLRSGKEQPLTASQLQKHQEKRKREKKKKSDTSEMTKTILLQDRQNATCLPSCCLPRTSGTVITEVTGVI